MTSSRGTDCVTSAQAGSVCVCACLYVCLPVKREKWREWDSKLTKALKCPSSLKNMEFVLLFLRTFYFLIAAFSVASSCGIREVSLCVRTLQLLQLLKHFTGFLHCHVLSFLSSLCGVTDHEVFVPKTRGFACLVCSVKGSARQEWHRQGEILGDLLQWRSVGRVETKSQR